MAAYMKHRFAFLGLKTPERRKVSKPWMAEADTDTARLFAYAERRAADTEFFIRKAIGWALREYSKTDPDAIRAFVDAHADELAGLTKREALEHL